MRSGMIAVRETHVFIGANNSIIGDDVPGEYESSGDGEYKSEEEIVSGNWVVRATPRMMRK